ncbi:MAG TPA: hypothetical protein VFP49_05210 [Nitrososphaeraceae archaeon]|nr:hypothetical protein [Nitrososphaeraceae archaeon]
MRYLDSLEHGQEVKDYIYLGSYDNVYNRIISKKDLGTHQEWAQIMQERIIKNY